MSGSRNFSYIDVFDNEEWSDCVVVFATRAERETSEDAPNKRQKTSEEDQQPQVIIGRPLPAHRVIICSGSRFFSSQATRWATPHKDDKPKLRVVLDSEDDVRFARSSIRFMYAGDLDVSSAADLLHVRRVAGYLQIQDCVEACDAALLARISADATSVAGVVELFQCRHLLGELSVAPSARYQFLHACRAHLIKCSTASVPASAESDPSFGNLLCWAFGDAVFVLNDLRNARELLRLSAAAMEALLSSDTFATDKEETVLLLLGIWLTYNGSTPEAVRHRLCRLIRLSQLSSVYLHSILPAIPWFPIDAAERRFLFAYVGCTDVEKAGLAAAVAGKLDCTSPWYAAPARPSIAALQCYEWSVSRADLEAQLATGGDKWTVRCKFQDSRSFLHYGGASWWFNLVILAGKRQMELVGHCDVPFEIPAAGQLPLVISTPPFRLVMYTWGPDGSRQEGAVWKSNHRCVQARSPLTEGPLPLAHPFPEPTAAAGDRLGALSPYFHDDKISGAVELDWSAQ